MQKTASKKRPRGQRHHSATLTDGEVDRMRQLHEEFPIGDERHLGYRKLARMFDVPRGTVQRICTYRDR